MKKSTGTNKITVFSRTILKTKYIIELTVIYIDI